MTSSVFVCLATELTATGLPSAGVDRWKRGPNFTTPACRTCSGGEQSNGLDILRTGEQLNRLAWTPPDNLKHLANVRATGTNPVFLRPL